MKYIWCNIKNFFKHKKLIFILTVFSVICSCIMIHFSYGLYQNYQLKKEYDLSDEREIALSLQGDFDEESDKELNDDESYFKPVDSVDNYITMSLLKKYVAEFNNSFTDKLKYIEGTRMYQKLLKKKVDALGLWKELE